MSYTAGTTFGRTHRRGFTLLELAIAIAVLSILSVGSLGYQYHSARDVRRAEARTAASRMAKMILDGWKGHGTTTPYMPSVPTDAGMTLTSSTIGPAPAVDTQGISFAMSGRYRVQARETFYYVTCSSKAATDTEPSVLNVAVAWRRDFADGKLDETAEQVRYSALCSQ